MSDQVDNFLKHYGVKGMKKPTPPHKLDRIYRVASGTAAIKDRIQKAKKASIKKVKADLKAKGQAQMAPNPELRESMVMTLLEKCGATKITDLG